MTGAPGPHLGARTSALVDGRLPADATARAESHLRACPQCEDAVEAERLVRARLRALAGPEPSDDLLQRLHGLGGPVGPLRPREQPMAGAPQRPLAPPPWAAAPSRRPPGRAAVPGRAAGPGRRLLRRRPLAALVGAFSLVGAGLVGAVLFAGVPERPELGPIAELSPWGTRTSTTPAQMPSTSAPDGR